MKSISKHTVDQLNKPRSAIISSITSELNEIQAPLVGVSQGLIHNICRRLLKDSGDCITMTKDQLFDSWDHTAVPQQDLERALDALVQRNFLTAEGGFIRIKSNSLGKYIHAAIEADVTALSKVEAMIAGEFHSYKSTKRYLSQQEIAQVEPVLARLILPTDLHQFVIDSIAYRRNKRIRRNTAIVFVIILLSFLTIMAFWQRNEAQKYADEVEIISAQNIAIEKQKGQQLAVKSDSIQKLLLNNQKLLISEQARADTEESARRAAEISKQDAERQRDSTARAKYLAEQERNRAILETQRAEREKQTADSATLVAIQQSEAADSAKQVAIIAQENAERLRSALLSTVLAEKSLSTPGGMQSDTMRAMVASVGYNVEIESHEVHDAHSVHPKLYSALYYAHKYLNRAVTYNYDKLSNKPIYAMSYDPVINTLYLSYGVGGLHSMRFKKHLEDEGFDFPAIDSIGMDTDQPTHNLNMAQDRLMVVSSDEYIFNVNLNNKQHSKHFISNGEKIVRVIPFQQEGEYLALTSSKHLYRYHISDGAFNKIENINGVSHVAYIKRLNILIYANKDNELHLVNYDKGITTHWGTRPGLSKLMIKDYGNKIYVVFGYLNGVIRVGVTDARELNSHDDKPSRSLRKSRMLEFILSSNTHKGFITDIAFAETTHTMVAASGDGTATIWNLEDWSHRQTDYRPIILDDHEGWVTSCAINAADNIVFTGTKRGVIKFWPLDPVFFAEKICDQLKGRSFTRREWGIYIGNEVPFKNQICK